MSFLPVRNPSALAALTAQGLSFQLTAFGPRRSNAWVDWEHGKLPPFLLLMFLLFKRSQLPLFLSMHARLRLLSTALALLNLIHYCMLSLLHVLDPAKTIRSDDCQGPSSETCNRAKYKKGLTCPES